MSPDDFTQDAHAIFELDQKISRLGEKLQQAEADAKASEMMLKQVCEERDNLRRRVDEAEGKWTGELMKNTDHEKSASVLQSFYQIEITKLRELLRDCPMTQTDPNKQWVIPPGKLREWVDLAKEEALKL